MAKGGSRQGRSKRIAEARARRSLDRPAPRLEPRETLLVVCEGSKTEPTYFEALRQKYRLRTVDVEICGSDKGTDPVSVVQCAFEKRKAKDFDHVWCVIDTESYRQAKERNLSSALQMAKDAEINVAVSNPCFEFWFLLHFERHGGTLGSYKATHQELAKHLPDYDKGEDVFDKLDRRTDTAITNAEHINQSQWQQTDDYLLRDPSTEAHLVVKVIRRIQRQGPQFNRR